MYTFGCGTASLGPTRKHLQSFNCTDEENDEAITTLRQRAWAALRTKIDEQTTDTAILTKLHAYFEERFRYDVHGDDIDGAFKKAKDITLNPISLEDYTGRPRARVYPARRRAAVAEGMPRIFETAGNNQKLPEPPPPQEQPELRGQRTPTPLPTANTDTLPPIVVVASHPARTGSAGPPTNIDALPEIIEPYDDGNNADTDNSVPIHIHHRFSTSASQKSTAPLPRPPPVNAQSRETEP
ncbi:hypothetical protein BJV78DRAFT_1352824 [Lactifluus subvellereus]|nr:hypothetical protein BJV78DRAFT_1352824 [Lactifluus subvellereus]